MRRLIRGRGQERGAVAVIVGLVAALFVLTGVAALAIDGGSIYTQRRVVQNGADAAAIALAQICAKADPLANPACANTSQLKDYLTGLAVANTSSGQPPYIESICGSGPIAGPLFDGCVDGQKLIDCVPWTTQPAATLNWVEVRTQALVPRVFSGFEKNDSTGKTVQACARAAWGPASTGPSTIPMTISYCEWQSAFDPSLPQPSTTDPLHPYSAEYLASPAAKDREKTLYFHDTIGANSCLIPPTGPSGFDLPGGFGYLDGDGCSVLIEEDLWYGAKPGDGYNSLKCDFKDPNIAGKIVYVPIFVETKPDSSGNNIEYKLDGVAAFYVTGFQVSGAAASKNQTSIVNGGFPNCTSTSQTCLFGWFTVGYMSGAEWTKNSGGTLTGAIGAGFAG